ncbi:hypothetical protein GCM10010911_20850 [Paenibacillus nasutitermitis]|uniref:Uncharacterized protein n=1 Tax=Paenibacillus nasutitermitis TaxID=1652958 RepID=A0A916YVP5_9BACL|nr:hypothetical protein GCM10010911_20850 [Paenibacillus nasutitermitis]
MTILIAKFSFNRITLLFFERVKFNEKKDDDDGFINGVDPECLTKHRISLPY